MSKPALIHYTDPDTDVPPGVDFLDAEQVRAWIAACEVEKPWRTPMRLRIAELVARLPPSSRVLELGAGPGLLAECVLERCTNVASYTLFDFSEHMLNVSRDRLKRFRSAQFVHANFKAMDWTEVLHARYAAVIAMQAVHEIRHKRHVPILYQQLRQIISPGGTLAVCDGTPGDSPELWRQSLFLTAHEQVDALTAAGFEDAIIDTAIGNMVLVVGRTSA
jgi:ubiquinone/menaquinone biosynthesis C-methylase UbiE